ncbi:hypothetical protein ANCCEY_05252 [Ancylostoma ceylanicum]|uniref:Protein kinase domain-containing protein n=1 Tax=Ancylostoma ceylanicum TaxID=53326 RepID=A0A0D6LZX6_9BILA|nr:hypothetical protein ANCCEY_05252 [Ancylostoma ceylanicum]
MISSHYVRQLLQALDSLHDVGIIHRDIRPHNIVLASRDNSAPLKLCGFGVAVKKTDSKEKISGGRVGVSQFMAPEVIAAEEYGTAVDIWSSGVVLYLLLSGKLPFAGSADQVYNDVKSGRYMLTGASWSKISEQARNLVSRMLTVDDGERITAKEALQHEWIQCRETVAPRKHLQEVVDNLRRYNQRRELKEDDIPRASFVMKTLKDS